MPSHLLSQSCIAKVRWVALVTHLATIPAGLCQLVCPGPGGSLSREDIASLVQMYLSNITAEVKSMGYPLEKLYTHLGEKRVEPTQESLISLHNSARNLCCHGLLEGNFSACAKS